MLARCTASALAVLSLAAGMEAARPRLPLGLDLYRPVPAANPLTNEKVSLGRRLFNERALSSDGSRSCASCHDPRRAFTNGRAVGIGVGNARGSRNVPTLINRAWGASFFWDGRVPSLEQQVLEPLFNPSELGTTPDGLYNVTGTPSYRSAFRKAFRAEPTTDLVARALASYVRTIVAGDTPYDRFAGGRRSALEPAAVRGLVIFRGKGGCIVCHAGPTFTDEQFHNTGVAWQSDVLADEGRARITGIDSDRGAFKTPTLREVARTAPYMHDGSISAIDAVIDFYDDGGRRNPWLDVRVRPLKLSRGEKSDLRSFLESLTGVVQDGR